MSEFNSTKRRIKRSIIKKTHKWLFAGEPAKRERFQEYVPYVKKQPKNETKPPPKEEPAPQQEPIKKTETEEVEVSEVSEVSETPKVGEIFPFSNHDWRVLDIQNNQALLLSELVLEERAYNKRAYNTKNTAITWEDCTLRDYLNKDFYNKLADKDKIVKKTIPNKSNQWFGTSGGYSTTTDPIFLLSIEEVVQYFGDSGQLKNKYSKNVYYIIDQYSEKRIAKDTNGVATWWLRSPGYVSNRAAYVNDYGYVSVDGKTVSAVGGVRPALWLNLQPPKTK
ncbi:MAG: DUF6273 domain-containing protein [Turicibacter sp.]|nr:DUF6273 domain-containing protein [Turicibacter sp.]